MSLRRASLVFTVPPVDGSVGGDLKSVLFTAPYDARITEMSYTPAGKLTLADAGISLSLVVAPDVADLDTLDDPLLTITITGAGGDSQTAQDIGANKPVQQLVGTVLNSDAATVDSGTTLVWWSTTASSSRDSGGTVSMHIEEVA